MNFTGKSPEWISNKPAGNDPNYPKQINKDFKLEKDLDKELDVFGLWRKSEAGEFSSGLVEDTAEIGFSQDDVKAFGRIGRPYLVAIGENSSLFGEGEDLYDGDAEDPGGNPRTSLISGVDLNVKWKSDGEVFKATVPYTKHRKGLIKGSYTGDTLEPETFIIPKVKLYHYFGSFSGVSGNIYVAQNSPFEEVFGSYDLNIRTGEITFYCDVPRPSKTTDSGLYLVIIY